MFRLYESTTLFFGDICGFTKLTAMSTASQTIKFLNDLYNIFDNAIDVFDVYKVTRLICTQSFLGTFKKNLPRLK